MLIIYFITVRNRVIKTYLQFSYSYQNQIKNNEMQYLRLHNGHDQYKKHKKHLK